MAYFTTARPEDSYPQHRYPQLLKTQYPRVTTNPAWPEIADHLQPGVKAVEDPVLTCQVFNAKLQRLLQLLRSDKSPLGGKPAYSIGVVEFQKRYGLSSHF